MRQCPECGSTEILSDLIVFADEMLAGQLPAYVQVAEPKPAKAPFIWIPKTVTSGLRASVCGACGYTRFHASNHAEMLRASKQGYTGREYGLSMFKP